MAEWLHWIGVAFILLPVLGVLALPTWLLYREFGWWGPAMLWGVFAAIFVPIWIGVALVQVANG